MFDNPDFYPTPESVIKQMLEPWLAKEREHPRRGYEQAALATMTILEPSAGSGNILDWMEKHLRHSHDGHRTSYSKNMYACESDPELKALLQGKYYKVIADDFLAYAADHQFDLIVMNPPFSAGDKHILHAYHTVAPGGNVVALINSESLRNPYTETRQLLAKLIEDHGSAEDLGQVFLDGERRTNVQVSLIRLQKPAGDDPLEFDFGSRSRERGPELTEDTWKDTIAVKDIIGNMMLGCEQAKKAFVDYMKARRALQFYGGGLVTIPGDILQVADEAIKSSTNQRGMYNEFSDVLNQNAWREVMGKLNVQKYMTHKVLNDFEQYGKQNGYMNFTKENVLALVDMVFENRGTIMEKAVTAVFDIFTSYHKENRLHIEGWKTNNKFKVNRKIILPYWVKWDDWSTQADLKRYGSKFSMNYHQYSEYGDIDRVMCYLTGEDFDQCYTIRQALETRFNRIGKVYPGTSFDSECESQFFDLKFFKKGTLHITFKDERLWQEFNLHACAGKLWLPEPEMQAYQNRKRSPFAQEPAPEVLTESRQLVASTTSVPVATGLQFSLFGAEELVKVA